MALHSAEEKSHSVMAVQACSLLAVARYGYSPKDVPDPGMFSHRTAPNTLPASSADYCSQ